MNRDKFKNKAVKVMDENCNQSMPADFKKYLENMELKITRENKKSSRLTGIYGGGVNALITITQRYETENETDQQVREDAFSRLNNPLPPQCKKLFEYDGAWRDVEDKSDYTFVKYLELVIKDDGYSLYAKFD